ncbi:MAG: hypothetical protein ABUT39_19525 [Acidobacteriota bacterium]
MAFRFKDLMIQVVANKGGGEGDPICTLATMDPDPKPEGIVPCTLATEPPPPTTIPAGIMPCTLATEPYPPTTGGGFALLRAGTGQETGICTLATMFPTPGLMAAATVTTVTTVTTLVQAAPTNLKDLKEQLRRSLAEIERREQADALPRTAEEADDLERRLEGALQELREHRKTLAKGAKKGGAKTAKSKK